MIIIIKKKLFPFKTVNAGHSCSYSQLARLLMADRTQSGRSSMEAVLMLDSLLVYSIMSQTHLSSRPLD